MSTKFALSFFFIVVLYHYTKGLLLSQTGINTLIIICHLSHYIINSFPRIIKLKLYKNNLSFINAERQMARLTKIILI